VITLAGVVFHRERKGGIGVEEPVSKGRADRVSKGGY
jgi:hypothetical protein